MEDKDLELLKEFGMENPPIQCPTCRHLQRGVFFPRIKMHRRKSSLSGENILSIYGPDCKAPVYSIQEWWSDKWDATRYGRDIDFSKPFFRQFAELYDAVPRMANKNQNTVNCDYTYSCGNSKNVYYSETVFTSEDVYYSAAITGKNDMVFDCLRCFQCSNIHDCVLSTNCTSSSYLFRCNTTSDSHFCIDCRGCTDCLFSSNLRNKSLHVFNKPVTRAEFEAIKARVLDGKHSTLQKSLEEWKKVHLKAIWRSTYMESYDDCTGDSLQQCAHCHECYDCINCIDDRYCWSLTPGDKNVRCMDLTSGGIGELMYNSVGLGGVGNYFLRMCAHCRQSSELTYCIDCYICKNCFGCAGLKNRQHCIFNKQYSKEEYDALVLKLIEHMKKTGEWGEFFPVTLSAFAYNSSISAHYQPMPKDEVLRRNWRWADIPEESLEGRELGKDVPDDIGDVSEEQGAGVLTCQATGKKFKVLPQELAFYRRTKTPLPRQHPDVRMERRRAMLNPHRLWDRQCTNCRKGVRSSYAPDRPEIIYCEDCYMKAVY